MSKSANTSPRVVPEGYRIRWRFFFLPVEVAGRLRYFEWIPFVQRFTSDTRTPFYSDQWHDVGFLDEFDALEPWDGEA